MKKGFTIIEILVVVFIVGLMSAILVVNWRKNEQTYLVQRTAQEIAQNIRKAQDLALSGKKAGTVTPSFYGVFYDKNDINNYIIFGDTNNNGSYQSSDWHEIIALNSGIEIYQLSSGNNQSLTIKFSIPDGFTTIDPSATSATIGIRKIGTTCPSVSCKNIIITNTGQITIQ